MPISSLADLKLAAFATLGSEAPYFTIGLTLVLQSEPGVFRVFQAKDLLAEIDEPGTPTTFNHLKILSN